MGDTNIVYGGFGIHTFQREIERALGADFWTQLTEGLELPDLETEAQHQCRRMDALMRRFEEKAPPEAVRAVLCRVRHGLVPAQSAWARQAFLDAGDLDVFLETHRAKEMQSFACMNREKKDFYGQPITDEVLAFVQAHPAMVAPVRQGSKLRCTAFPCHMERYLHAADDRMKRYHACHCPFAKESILTDRTVSPTLCHCSLGHVMNFVEAFLDRPLQGRVLSSVLAGDLLCEYEIDLPDDVMAQYVSKDTRE